MTAAGHDALEGYELVGELGRGTFGVVVLARQVALDRLVAVKRVTGAFAVDEEARARLQREAQALARLEHPNIVRLYDFRRDGRDAAIIMEYVPGESLDRRLARGEMSTDTALAVLTAVAAALEHAHSRGIVHRDVKPANVLLSESGEVKLADFGLARVLAGATALRTRAGTVMGTPAYMAPEQVLGERVDERTDAYAYSVLAYELLTGQRPFAREDAQHMRDAHLFEPPPPPNALVSDFPARASAAIMRGLAKDPAQRASVREVANAITRVPSRAWPHVVFAPSAPTPASDAGATDMTVGAVAQPVVAQRRARAASSRPGDVPDVEPPVFAPAPRRRRTRRNLAIGLAIGLGIVALAAGWLVLRRHGANSSLAVREARVSVAPVTAHCPRATFVFDGTIATNGADGTAQVRWRRPDGAYTTPQTLRVLHHDHTATATLHYTVEGNDTATVDATLEVLAPQSRSATSPTAHYTCNRSSP